MRHTYETSAFRDIITLTNKYFGNWENGTNEGLARIVVNKEADFGPTGGIMKAIRVPTLDFVVPIGRFRLVYYQICPIWMVAVLE